MGSSVFLYCRWPDTKFTEYSQGLNCHGDDNTKAKYYHYSNDNNVYCLKWYILMLSLSQMKRLIDSLKAFTLNELHKSTRTLFDPNATIYFDLYTRYNQNCI